MVSPVILLSSTALLLLALYRYLLHPLFLSPLSKVPSAHWSAPLTPLWILHIRFTRRENRTLHALHRRLGPVIRLAPSELSVHGVDGGIRIIYGGGWEKGEWYSVFTNYGGVRNSFSSLGHGDHSRSKRLTSNSYAKSTMLGSKVTEAVVREVVCKRLLPRLKGVAERGEEVEAYELFSGAAMDFVTGYIFGVGQGSRFLLDEKHCKRWVVDYKARQEFTFWPQELPRLTAGLARVGIRLVPKWVDVANRNIEDWVMGLCDAAEGVYGRRVEVSAEEQAAVYNHLRVNLKKANGEKPDIPLSQEQRMVIASELLDHAAAGFDTTGITLTYLAWELSRSLNQEIQKALRQEIQACQPLYRASAKDETAPEIPSCKSIDELPMLHAVVMETLRLHAAIPGGQPRVTPENAELGLGGEAFLKGLPAGVRVNSAAFTLHLNEDVYPDPDTWQPQRWLTNDGQIDGGGEKARWFWAFGSGGRMCIGSNLAMLELKVFVAAIWSNFETTIADDEGMVHADGYTAEPVGTLAGDYLRLRLKKIDE